MKKFIRSKAGKTEKVFMYASKAARLFFVAFLVCVFSAGNILAQTVYNVVGGGNECADGLGFDIGLDGSDVGVNYQLYLNTVPIGGLVPGTGINLDMGLQTGTGVYTVKANPGLPSETAMAGSASINVVAAPASFNVTGGGTYCEGGTGYHIFLSNSELGVDYHFYKDGLPTGLVIGGTGTSLDFGLQMSSGVYKVVATKPSTTCSVFMNDSAVVVYHPNALKQTVTGGGAYCEGGNGVHVGLMNSEVSVSYQLYLSELPYGPIVEGTGLPIDFGLQTEQGQYAVVANPASVCATTMTNSVSVTVNPNPTSYNVTGTGGYCAGGAGLHVYLSGSNTGISYQLYNGNTVVGTALDGTGNSLDFGAQTAEGSYSVIATNKVTGCTRTMSGNAVITVYPLPAVYAVTGGGGFCQGSAGVHVGLNGSTSGIDYTLFWNGIPQGSGQGGSGSAIDFGLIAQAGTYSVVATNPSTHCSAPMSGSAVVIENALPAVYNVSGTGSLCAGGPGVHIYLNNSATGVNYQLYNESGILGVPVAGSGSLLDMGAITTQGTYTVVATNISTTCQKMMNGTAEITVNALPIVSSVTGGGAYCQSGAGVLIGMGASEAGVTYNLRLGNSTVGSVVSTGGSFNFSPQMTAGTYSVVAVNSNSCSSNMSGTASVSINPLPTAYNVTLNGSNSYCSGGAGINVLLSNSASGIDYQLYYNGAMVGLPVSGTGLSLDFGPQTSQGTYTVIATNTITGCSRKMTNNPLISINQSPAVIAVTGGGHYCSGGTGVPVGMGTSESGLSYQLVNQYGIVGSPVIGGAGTPISFGLQTVAGTYSVIATNLSTSCRSVMSGDATVSIDPLPAAYTVSGGGIYCSGGNGYTLTLSGSQTGVDYQLYRDGSMVNGAVSGTGSMLNLGLQTAQGTYSVIATNTSTGCIKAMSGTTTISVNAAPTVFAVTGGGAYCSGGAGVNIGVGSSTIGVTYRLYNGATFISSTAGTGNAVDFGAQTAEGTYSVSASHDISGCTVPMSGSATVSINALPNVYVMGGTGSNCAGANGVDVFLSNSNSGINYQLYRNASLSGAPIPGVNGPLDFGMQTLAGAYTVIASDAVTGCSINMSGTATVTINPLPTVFAITGGGAYCQDGAGVLIGLNSSSTGVNYRLYSGNTLMSSKNGTGSAISFGQYTTAGTYTVVAVNNSTYCTTTMSGVATVSVNGLPTVYPVIGGGSFCSNASGVPVSLDYSDAGISYQLYVGSTPVGVALTGVDGQLDFGLQTAVGTYSVMATNMSTTCAAGMDGGAIVSTVDAPVIYAVTGGGSFCQGGAGVHVGLSSSQLSTSYELFRNGTSADVLAGTGNALDFGFQTAVGTYSIVATSGSCVSSMSGFATVSENQLPDQYTLLGAASSYCAGGTGVDLVLTNSQFGVNYQLINGSANVGFAVPGTGSMLDFGPQTLQGTYIVLAVDAATTCSQYMSSSASVVVSPLPTIYTVTGGGGFCAGSGGSYIGLSGSNSGITYKLYRGSVQVASKAGTGSAIDFGQFATAGTYSVLAINNTTTCSSNMAGFASVSQNAVPDAYTVTGGGRYCLGNGGVHVGLGNSATGVNYQLYANGTPVGFPVAGTGAALDFGAQTTTGIYTAVGINSLTACGADMTGTVSIATDTLPLVYTLTGGGHYCDGGNGVSIQLSGSNSGITYRLYRGSTLVSTMMGTGTSLNFGPQTVAGSYVAVATNTVTTCAVNMSGALSVSVDALPDVFTVGGGGGYCAGGAGSHITLGGSQSGVNYQLYNSGGAVGFPVAGTGLSLDLGAQAAAGSYSVVATAAATGCVKNMSSSATVSVIPVSVPSVSISTGMGDSVCSGITTTFTAVTVNGGTTPSYQWKVNGIPAGVSASNLAYIPSNGDVVSVTVTSNAACAASATASATRTISVLTQGMPSVNISADPGNAVCEGTMVTFSANPAFGGTAPSYLWLKNGAPVGTGATYSYVANSGDIILCMMVSNYPCRFRDTAFSNTITMAVDAPVVPSVTLSPDPGTGIAEGTSLTITANVSNTGTAAPKYEWYVGNELIPGATFSTLTSTAFRDKDSVTCVVTSGNACALSAFNSMIIHVFPLSVTHVAAISDVKLLPNPNKGDFFLKGTLNSSVDEEVSVEVTNMLGQVVYRNRIIARGGIIDEQIQLSGMLANGMYILNMRAGNEGKVFHVVVEQ